MKIAENLKKLREKKGLSQMQLAEKAGVHKLPVAQEVEEHTRRLEEALINGEPIDDLI